MSRSFVRRLAGSLKAGPASSGLDEELAEYLDLADVLLFVLSPDGVVQLANRQCSEVFGRFASELVGRSFSDLVVLDDDRRRSSVGRSDGTVRRVDWRFAARHDEAGAITAIVASGQDVTDQEAAEDQLNGLRRLAQDVAALDDARDAIVGHAVALTGAAGVALVEGGMVTATAGVEFCPDGRATGHGPCVHEPVRVGDAIVAVLVFTGAPAPASPRAALIPLMADETATALRRIAALRTLEEAAMVDSLTGVANRRAFDRELPLALARARRAGDRVALATLDLNGFKALNDSLGHEAGDRVLKETAAAWTTELRTTDFIARLGGDEFAVILPACGGDGVRRVVRRLRAAVPHTAGTSIGIAVWDGRESPSGLMRRSDQALYADKTFTRASPVRSAV